MIALIGQSETEDNQPHLHFELWHKGNPINPEKYVVFLIMQEQTVILGSTGSIQDALYK